MSKAGERLIKAANEARAIARGDLKAARVFIPADIDVRAIRQKMKLSQDDFAAQFCFSVNQIKDWEQGRSRPLGGVRAYLMIIDREPEAVLRLLEDLRKDAANRAAA
jgi:putative transcriptional regulator